MVAVEIDISEVVKDILQEFDPSEYEIEGEDSWSKDYAIFQCIIPRMGYDPYIGDEEEDDELFAKFNKIMDLIKSQCKINPEILVKGWEEVVSGPEIEVYREK